jgi:hypothetical protein
MERLDTTPYGVTIPGIDFDNLTSDGRRWVRAVTEQMLVVPETTRDGETTSRFRVFSESGSEYLTDLNDPQRPCDCPDMKHNAPENGCKHLRRVELLRSDPAVPLPDATGDDVSDYWPWFDARVHAVESEAAILEARDGTSKRADNLRVTTVHAKEAADIDRGDGDNVDRGTGIETDGGRNLLEQLADLERGDRVLFNDRKQPLTVQHAYQYEYNSSGQSVSAIVEGPRGATYRLSADERNDATITRDGRSWGTDSEWVDETLLETLRVVTPAADVEPPADIGDEFKKVCEIEGLAWTGEATGYRVTNIDRETQEMTLEIVAKPQSREEIVDSITIHYLDFEDRLELGMENVDDLERDPDVVMNDEQDIDRGEGVETDGGTDDPTPLEAVERADKRLHPAVNPSATLHLVGGDRRVELSPLSNELPTDLANAGIIRAAQYAVVDEPIRGVIGETEDGSLYHLRRRDGLQATPATLTATFIPTSDSPPTGRLEDETMEVTPTQ